MCDVRNCFNTGNMHKVIRNGKAIYYCGFHYEDDEK